MYIMTLQGYIEYIRWASIWKGILYFDTISSGVYIPTYPISAIYEVEH